MTGLFADQDPGLITSRQVAGGPGTGRGAGRHAVTSRRDTPVPGLPPGQDPVRNLLTAAVEGTDPIPEALCQTGGGTTAAG